MQIAFGRQYHQYRCWYLTLQQSIKLNAELVEIYISIVAAQGHLRLALISLIKCYLSKGRGIDVNETLINLTLC